MKAVVLNTSIPEKIEVKELALPKLGPKEVLIKVKAAALNHRDEWCRQGLYPGLKDGVTLGSDGAGVVEKIGDQVDSGILGKEIIINPAMNWGDDPLTQSKDFKILGMPDHGTLASYVKVNVDRVHHKPDHMSWEEAAALPLGGVTAYRALMVQGGLKAEDKVLVTGFGGGVAQFAAQFAIARGAAVYVSSSSEKKLKKGVGIGAKGIFNYTDSSWTSKALEQTGGFDLIIDSAMGDTLSDLIKVVKPGGRIVFYGATKGNPPQLDARKVFWNQIRLIGSTMGSDSDFEAMLAMVSKQKIKPLVDEVYGIEDVVKAFDKMKMGGQMGKIVVKP
ncbi:zinc-binding dehydrogenase [Belliella sp. DSM 111904]|uniref:Zinc-binding dehydrogenase n=1 Tax=Belliella filtrata TaxID=2923435 RepID=A0ABS9V3J2_9BACT|nr:zinc-binding dehydrogenase [Belliella filtrata]MCH7410984.1 zinc-binding dehydrogenase [Belliella filtrata]